VAGLVARLLRRNRFDRITNDADYWSARASAHGERAVLHLGHGPDEVDAVTARQRRLLMPLLRRALDGGESTILDFGCGSGRFTKDLAAAVGGTAIGVDPTAELLRLASGGPGVEFRLLENGRVPLPEESVDAVWCAIVLGCITRESSLTRAADEILRVLRPGGLVFLVENTTPKRSGPHFVFRTVEEYRALFRPLPLAVLGGYTDLDETITVMAGRSPLPGSPP